MFGLLAAIGTVATSGQGANSAFPLPSGFVVTGAGSLTSSAGEVIAGRYSIKGVQSGDRVYTAYLRTAADIVPFAPGATYVTTFRYTILEAPDRGFEMLFFSPTAASRGSFVPSHSVSGAAGSTGVATLRVTLGNFTDYVAQWTIVGKGAIAIDDIRIEDERHRVTVASEDAEGQSPRIRLARAFLPVARLGQPVDIALPAVGGRAPYQWRAATIPPPAGLQIDADSRLSGRPTASGAYLFDALVTDATGATVRVPLRLTVSPIPDLPPAEPLSVAGGLATVRPREYERAFRNPLGGIRDEASTARDHPYTSLARQYIEWNVIERDGNDGVERIRQVTDQLFGDLPSHNIKAIPRVYLIWPDPLARYWPSDLTPDDYSSSQFRDRMQRLIARLGEVWNNDPRIAFVEMGIIGYWGEHHTPRFSQLPREVEREFGDAYLAAFPDKLLMHRYPTELTGYPFGMHWDVFGHNHPGGGSGNYTTNVRNELAAPAQRDKWKRAPRGGELAPDFLSEPDWSRESKENVIRKHTPWLLE